MSDFIDNTLDETEVDTIIAEDADFDGELLFEKPLIIKGKFKGEISAHGDLYINEDAVVEATIQAQSVSVKGKVVGNIHAEKRLEMYSSSTLVGNIKTPDLVMQSGCIFNGKCEMKSAQIKKEEIENE